MQITEIMVKRHRGRGNRNDTLEARATLQPEEDVDEAMDDLHDYLADTERRQLDREARSWKEQDVRGGLFSTVHAPDLVRSAQ